jgi:hypothetical protein
LDELSAKVAFIEARLTLLERKFARMVNAAEITEPKPAGPVNIPCDAPGMLISRMYDVELDEEGTAFCWVGNEGPIQFVLPLRPTHALTCTLHIQPHPSVDFTRLSIRVNDDEQPITKAYPTSRMLDVSFPVPSSGAPNLSILLLGVDSRRPSDVGENLDKRLLAARFFGATVVYC